MAGHYSLIDYDSDEENNAPTMKNLVAAARFIRDLLQINGVTWAFTEGFSMNCRLSPRPTKNIHLVVDLSMRSIWALIETQTRLVIPDSKLIEGIIKIFVRTGPTYGDLSCEVDFNVECNISVQGAHGVPINVSQHREIVRFRTSIIDEHFYVLDIFYALRTLLHSFYGTVMEDDFYDIAFLLASYPGEVASIRSQLDVAEVRCFLACGKFGVLDKEIKRLACDSLKR